MLTIKVMQALYGDCIQVRFLGQDGKNHNIIIDTGFSGTYVRTLKAEANIILRSKEKIDLFIITHTDQDHIGAISSFIKEYGNLKDFVDVYWFNGGYYELDLDNENKISIRQGIELADYLKGIDKVCEPSLTSNSSPIDLFGSKITILSPCEEDLKKFLIDWKIEEERINNKKIVANKYDWDVEISELIKNSFHEDNRLENGVSIAFIFECNGNSVLFLSDSHPSVIIKALIEKGFSEENKLKVNFVKLSHHGSKYNTNYELLALIDCDSFIISANGKNQYYFPHKEALARILTNPKRDLSIGIKLIFNYKNDVLDSIFNDLDYSAFNFECLYPEEDENGYTIRL